MRDNNTSNSYLLNNTCSCFHSPLAGIADRSGTEPMLRPQREGEQYGSYLHREDAFFVSFLSPPLSSAKLIHYGRPYVWVLWTGIIISLKTPLPLPCKLQYLPCNIWFLVSHASTIDNIEHNSHSWCAYNIGSKLCKSWCNKMGQHLIITLLRQFCHLWAVSCLQSWIMFLDLC